MALTYDDFIQRINIQDLLLDAGYKLNRKDGIRYPSYVKTDASGHKIKGDKFIVNPARQLCFQPPEQKVYNVISFIKQHPNFFPEYKDGMNLDHLVNLVCNRLLNQPINHAVNTIILPSVHQKDFDIKEYELLDYKKYDFSNIKQFYPYFKDRHINIDTQKAFAHHFFLATLQKENGTKLKNLSFPLRIPGHEAGRLKDIVGFEQRGRARLDGRSGYKGMARGSNSSEGLWIASPNNTELKSAKKVLWFESAYDAMAYYQLHVTKDNSLNNAVFLSSGGHPTVMQLRGVIIEAKEASHHLCFDNDLAGNQFVENFKSEWRKINEKDSQISPELNEYAKSLSDPNNYLSGNYDLLPDDLRVAYGKWESAEGEWHSLKQAGSIHPDDLNYYANIAIQQKESFKAKLQSAFSSQSISSSIVREVPEEGIKDWNDMLIKQASSDLSKANETQTIAGGVDINGDGIISTNESDQRKIHSFSR